jgi:hypothetical protein
MSRRIGRNQSGFGFLGLLPLVTAILIVAGSGYFVWNRSKKSEVSSSATSSGASTSHAVTEDKGTALVIKEWGVQLLLPSNYADAYYVVSNNSVDDDGSPNTIWLGTKTFDAAGCKAIVANEGGKPIASISRVLPTDTDPVQGTLDTELYPNGAIIGKYYYLYKSWAKSNKCVRGDLLSNFDNAFTVSIKSARATPTTRTN